MDELLRQNAHRSSADACSTVLIMSAAAQSRSPSPKRPPQQQRAGGIGELSSPKFSFRAALIQHKASKLASKTTAATHPGTISSTTLQAQLQPPQQSTLQPSSISRPIRGVNTSNIPSLSGRGRFNSTSIDSSFTAALPARRDVDTSLEAVRASSALGKRTMDEHITADSPGDSSMMSDFGPVMRKSTTNGPIAKSLASSSTRSRIATSKLPGPPSARSQWNSATASNKSMPSPSSSKAPHKIRRSDGVAEVHAPNASVSPQNATISSTPAPPGARIGSNPGSARHRTISASTRPILSSQQHKPMIGTLPKPKAKSAPIKTLLDEKPIQLLRPALLGGLPNEDDDDTDSDDDDDEDERGGDEDALEGPDVSRIRTRRVTSYRADDKVTTGALDTTQTNMLPPARTVEKASRIPSIGSNTLAQAGKRPHRRSSSNSVNTAFATAANEKENISQAPAGLQAQSIHGSKRNSIGAVSLIPGRSRTSLPLAVTQLAASRPRSLGPTPASTESTHVPETVNPEAVQTVESIPASPTKTSSLSALRSRGLQTDSAKPSKPDPSSASSIASRASRQDLGIRASIIQANPVHPSILALQAAKATQHQPISTPEALNKAKKRLSGALLTSSSSSSSVSAGATSASPSERTSSLARSTSINRFGSLNKMQSAPRTGLKQMGGAGVPEGQAMTPSSSTSFMPRSGSRSPIKSSLLLFPAAVSGEANAQRERTPASPTKALVRSSALDRHKSIPSSSEIDANLLASLRVVAQKANLKVGDLMDEEKRLKHQQQPQNDAAAETATEPSRPGTASAPMRSQREASEELEALAGDVSVDLMALDLAAGSPASDISMLRSPALRDGGIYLDTPPSVLAAMAAPKPAFTTSQLGSDTAEGIANDDGDTTAHIEDDDTDTSCASPSLRAAAASQRHPRQHGAAVPESSEGPAETPVRRQGYRNVPSIPSTPFPTAGSQPGMTPSRSVRAYPPSAALSAKTRSRLKKALRESLGLEAHFASMRAGSHDDNDDSNAASNTKVADREPQGEQAMEGTSAKKDIDVRKSISAMLLTEDDRYLDELVSAVARIGLEDLAPEQIPPPQDEVEGGGEVESKPASPTKSVGVLASGAQSDTASSAALQTQLSAALSDLASLRAQLELSQTHSSDLESQLAIQAAAHSRTTRTQALLETDLAALKAEMAGMEWVSVPNSHVLDLSKVTPLSNLLPSFYNSSSDEICFRNGIRYVNCQPDNNSLVKLDSTARKSLHQYLLENHDQPNVVQSLVYIMLLDLDRDLHQSYDAGAGEDQESSLRQIVDQPRAKQHGIEISVDDIDPNINGPAVAKKLGSPNVTRKEEECYAGWLREKFFGEGEVDTVLNELYVRHVAITQDSKIWEVRSVTGCYDDEQTEETRRKKDLDEGDDVVKVQGPGIHLLKERSMREEDRDGDGIEDDMEVYHPILGTHMKDPWEKYRRFAQHGGEIESGVFGYRNRSLQGCGRVGGLQHHRHSKRGGANGGGKDVKPYIPSTTPFGADQGYSDNLPSAPVDQSTAGAGSSSSSTDGGSAISSKPHGFAASVTGGGSSTPVIPKDIHELVQLLSSPQPQVIHLDKVYDFRTSEGTCNNCAGCIPDSYPKCPSQGQLAIDNGQGWCKGKPSKTVTYDKAGLKPIEVKSNKSVIGITADAAVRGKGLRIAHAKNVILHNFRIDQINPQYIWGGDGVTLYDTDLVWIDKITFSLIGRQFIVTGYQSAGRVTISNCLFDGATKWSATCDGAHYWTVLGYGSGDKVTFSANVMKNCSGRSPRIANPNEKGGQEAVWHLVNTVFTHNSGHSLDMGPGISALIEGNVFNDVAQTSLHEANPGKAFAPSDQAVCTQCKGPLGRNCQPNAYQNANPVPSTTSPADVLKDVAGETMGGALPPGQVMQSVGQNAGCGGKGAGVVGQDAGGDGSEREGYGSTGGAVQVPQGAAGAAPDVGSEASPGAGQVGSGVGSASSGAYMPGIGWAGSSGTSAAVQQESRPGQAIAGGTSTLSPSSDGSAPSSDGQQQQDEQEKAQEKALKKQQKEEQKKHEKEQQQQQQR
ncbi:pectin lyase F [Pseudozyma hubeiensis SY62]|uniref:pectin lyase n=1 Tax=Pseudozyma hubeiensis (strain SY62) TaxID=1305764 RepID=R9PJM0_PSEHS|nr:pectin lyase F [Pseudozyma hubeiensis SY62]GAC98295.1 pectin lyase F [Pseudozyma hubeiensis SY62]